ncbi:MAG: SIMPL domain-containing protein [Candidatus Binatia bacterium]
MPNRLATTRNLVAAALAALTVLAPGAGAAELPPPRTIRVSGDAMVKAAPDRARISVSVVTRAATAGEATAANGATSKAVMEKLRSAVPAPGEVRTAGYELTPEYDYNQERPGRGAPTLVGYVSTNRFAIVTADLAGVGALIDAAVASGANQIDSIAFFLDDEEAPRRQALLEAGKRARSEAETIAQSLGVGLGEVLDASSSSNVPPQPMFGREKAMMMDSAAASTELVPGSLEIRASMSVTFAIP